MLYWNRKSSLSLRNKRDTETWIRNDEEKSSEFEIDLYLGKKTNLVVEKQELTRQFLKLEACSKKLIIYFKLSIEKFRQK